jgi:RNA-directed DNA polymerase
MTGLYKQVCGVQAINTAWRSVREKSIRSASGTIRNEVSEFEERSPQNIKSIQDRLRKGSFSFKPQLGVAKKRPGKSSRPIVISSIENKVVHRAILDVLQASVPSIARLASVPTSFGGVKGKSVRQAIEMVRLEAKAGKVYFIRSDIPNFFTKVDRVHIRKLLADSIDDSRFLSLVLEAIETNLENYEALKRKGEDSIFPLWDEGVAQGSSLSPMLANLYLYDFDMEMNKDSGFLCIRYVDDFLILGSSEKVVSTGFRRAKAILRRLGLDAYSPESDPQKASRGRLANGLEFLGCHLDLESVRPSKTAAKRLLASIDAEVRSTKVEISRIMRGEEVSRPGCYAKALTNINNIVWGWGKAFSFCNRSHYLNTLDGEITKRLKAFDVDVRKNLSKSANKGVRAILGVRMVVDALDVE